MRPRFFAQLIFVVALVCSCDIVVPPDPPTTDKRLLPDNYAFDQIDLLPYEFTGTTRVDCAKVQSALTKYGACLPVKTAIGSMVRCPMQPPFETFEYGCLTMSDTPAVFIRMKYRDDAQNVDFPELGRDCTFSAAGPAAGEPERYPTDIGYKACLFKATKNSVEGRLSSDDANARPIGLFADFSAHHATPEALQILLKTGHFSGPMTLTLDARYFEDAERDAAFQSMSALFNVYRAYALRPDSLEADTSSPIP